MHMRSLRRLASAIAIGATVTGCSDLPSSPELSATASPAHMWADEDCNSLVVCYRGMDTWEAMLFMGAVGGSPLNTNLSEYDRNMCLLLKQWIIGQQQSGEAGVWTGSWNNRQGVTHTIGEVAGRSGVQPQMIGNSYLWFHEAYHSYFLSGDESQANYYAQACRNN